MTTMVVSRTCQPEADRLAAAAKQVNWKSKFIDCHNLPLLLPRGPLALHAETDIAFDMADLFHLCLIEPTFDLLARLPERYLKREVKFTTLTAGRTMQRRIFMKPADCVNKSFEARVYEQGDHIRFVGPHHDGTPVLVSEPVDFKVEYRVFTVDRRVATFSPYILGGFVTRPNGATWNYSRAEAADMIDFCTTLLDDASVPFPPAATLDVGFLEGVGWAVVEINPVWCSGIIAANDLALLPVMARACIRRRDLTAADRAWVIERDPEQVRRIPAQSIRLLGR